VAGSPDRCIGPDPGLIVLADNDIILKLAACNLLNEAVARLGASPESVWVLPTARFKIGKDRKLPIRYGTMGVSRALAFVKACREVDDPDLLIRAKELTAPGIDEGEALLMTSAAGQPESLLATGDKSSLIQLCKDPAENLELRMSLAGRVVCFEAILMALIRDSTCGFEQVRRCVVDGLLTDQAIDNQDVGMRVVFSRGHESPHDSVVVALQSYFDELRHQTGDLLLI
jgi:hypothetical protein